MHPDAEEARFAIAPFAELEKSPEHVHTYRLTTLGLWNARAAGFDAEWVVDALLTHSRFPLPQALLLFVTDTMARYGVLSLHDSPIHGLILTSTSEETLAKVRAYKKVAPLLGTPIDSTTVPVHPSERGRLKSVLLSLSWPVEDFAGYIDGEQHPMFLTSTAPPGASGQAAPLRTAPSGTAQEGGRGGSQMPSAAGWSLRPYQADAVHAFTSGGSGVVVLPCGAGKTVVGAAAMTQLSRTTLILVTNTVSARQWRAELLRRTSLTESEIGEYSGQSKQVRPVTIATYQVLTSKRGGVHTHLELMSARDWGLIVYDEVHLLPAPVFRMTADLQARRRLGLTATLVREDGRENDVFSLIGPKRFEAPWKEIEAQGWIAPAQMTEVRVRMPQEDRAVYRTLEAEAQHRFAGAHGAKLAPLEMIAAHHRAEPLLVIGQYLDQLEEAAQVVGAPLLTGRTPVKERERLFAAFRCGEITRLVVSKVANFSIDLPDASVAVQISGAFGSRQEEAQRLGRILRPKSDGRSAHFYSLVTRDSTDQDFAANRQRFLAEQGYRYTIVDASDLSALLSRQES